MQVLVVGGTGNVGSRAAESLAAKGMKVRCLTRSPEKLAGLVSTIDARVGDLMDPSSLPACYEDCDAVLIVLTLSQHEEEQGENAVAAAIDAGMKKIVYVSVVQPPGSEKVPHLASKVVVEASVRSSNIPFVILRPNSFFQNEYRSRVPLVEFSVFNTPFGHVGINRVDVRDVAEAGVRMLTSSEFDSRTMDLHGPEALTGPVMAEAWSRHLQRPVTYTGDDIDSWEKSVSPFLPPWMTRDLRAMYELFHENGVRATHEQVELSRKIVGNPLRTYDAFVRETVVAWKAA